MPAFSPSTYLASQGWSGPGSGLRPDSRAKPVTVIKRKDLLGLGKERDSSFAWWDDVFKAVADKVGGSGVSRQPQRTTTGIISPLPPSQGASVNVDLIATAKQAAARRQLYGRFLRGQVIQGSVEEDEVPPGSTTPKGKARGGQEDEQERKKAEKRARKAARLAMAAVSSASTSATASPADRASPSPRSKRRKEPAPADEGPNRPKKKRKQSKQV